MQASLSEEATQSGLNQDLSLAHAGSVSGTNASVGSANTSEWHGALNETHVDKAPAHDGALTQGKAAGACETQATLQRPGKDPNRDHNTCTSCKPGHHFMLVWAKSRLGKCHAPGEEAEIQCSELNVDDPGSNLMKSDFICTKSVLSKAIIVVDKLTGEAKNHFSKARHKSGYGGGYAEARCAARKEV